MPLINGSAMLYEYVLSMNGNITSLPVYTGYQVSVGDFVQLVYSNGTTYVKPCASTIDGVAKSSGSAGSTVDVYVPYYNPLGTKLPSGYTQLEYIQSNGTQFIDTGFKPNQNTRVVMDLQGTNTNTSGVYMHYGVPSFMAGKASSSSWNYYVYYSTQEVAYSTRTASNFIARHTIDQNKNVITTGSDTKTLTTATFSSSYNMYLFGVNNNGSLSYASPIRVFSCKIYDNGTLIRDYVPCKNSSGTIGLYDLVNSTFSTNSTGNSFIAGPQLVVHSLPDGYTALAAIKSSGTQYINTGYKVTSENLRMVLKFKYLAAHSTTSLFGSESSSSSSTSGKYTICPYDTPQFYVGNTTAISAGSTSLNTSYVLDVTANNGSLSVVWDSTSYSASYSGKLNHAEAIALFGNNISGTVSQISSLEVEYFQIYDNNTLVRYLVPVSNSSGSVGMYDLVNHQFYANAGTGVFVAV